MVDESRLTSWKAEGRRREKLKHGKNTCKVPTLGKGTEQEPGRPEQQEVREKGKGWRREGEQGLEHQRLVGYVKNFKISESSSDLFRILHR